MTSLANHFAEDRLTVALYRAVTAVTDAEVEADTLALAGSRRGEFVETHAQVAAADVLAPLIPNWRLRQTVARAFAAEAVRLVKVEGLIHGE